MVSTKTLLLKHYYRRQGLNWTRSVFPRLTLSVSDQIEARINPEAQKTPPLCGRTASAELHECCRRRGPSTRAYIAPQPSNIYQALGSARALMGCFLDPIKPRTPWSLEEAHPEATNPLLKGCSCLARALIVQVCNPQPSSCQFQFLSSFKWGFGQGLLKDKFALFRGL